MGRYSELRFRLRSEGLTASTCGFATVHPQFSIDDIRDVPALTQELHHLPPFPCELTPA